MTERPDVSLVVPCYNEEATIRYTLPRLVKAFTLAGYRLELVACDNGSSDGTGDEIRRFAQSGLPVVPHRVDVNQGYGWGVLSGFTRCTAPIVGMIPADGQVDAEDAVKVFEAVLHASVPIIGKVRRRFRLESPRRWVVSVIYNLGMVVVWPGIRTLDVNGTPKFMPRHIVDEMALESKDWMLDAEIMIKAKYMGVGVIEMNVFSRMRETGTSKIGATTILQFLRRLADFRFGSGMREWRARRSKSVRA